MPTSVIFDLDGTLIDSATVLITIINEMLAERGSARVVDAEQARPFLSLGGLALVSGLLGSECGNPDAEVSEFRKRYTALPTPAESLYEGVRDGLRDLAESGLISPSARTSRKTCARKCWRTSIFVRCSRPSWVAPPVALQSRPPI